MTRVNSGPSGKRFDLFRIVAIGYLYHTASVETSLDPQTWTEIEGSFSLSSDSDSSLAQAEAGAGVVYVGDESGRALVMAQCALNSAGAGDSMALGVCIDDVIISDGDHGHVVDSATGDAHVTVIALVSVEPGQKISLRLLNHTDGSDATVIHLGLVVVIVA